MRAIADTSLYLNPSETLYSNNGKTDETISPSKTKAATKTTESDTTKDTTASTELPRETYGLDTIERMTDEEYAAFQRATSNMSPNEKIQAAQSLHLVAKSFEEAQKMLSGGGMVAALSGESEDSGYFKSNPDMIDKGISVLRQMSSGDGKSMANFLTSYKGALSSSGGLNISA
jgi:hypothetical protein